MQGKSSKRESENGEKPEAYVYENDAALILGLPEIVDLNELLFQPF